MTDPTIESSRRQFLRFLASSPLWPRGLGKLWQDPAIITSPAQALEVMDFEAAARKVVPAAHWGYLATGVDDDGTVRANQTGFDRFAIRPRRLRDVTVIDTSARLLGDQVEAPIFLCPVGSGKAFHPEGETAVARAARAKGLLQLLSTVTTTAVEEVVKARGGPVWFQLYPTDDWAVAAAMVRRAERAGCPTLVLTVDLKGATNRLTQARAASRDERTCSFCHAPEFQGYVKRKPMFDGLDLGRATGLDPNDLSWTSLKRLRDLTKMKLVLKGILTREDAALAVRYGVDAIIVSNHGGRAENTNRSTIETLPEVLAGAAGRIPVFIDGGFRRGTDVFKAFALGAQGVGIGRPYIWGLAAFGQPGVEAVLELFRRELQVIMRQCGTRSIREIGQAFVMATS